MTGSFNPTTHSDFVEAIGLTRPSTCKDSAISHTVVDVDESMVVQDGTRPGLPIPNNYPIGLGFLDTKEADTDLSIITTQNPSEEPTSAKPSSSVFSKSSITSGDTSYSDSSMTTSRSQSSDFSPQSPTRSPPSAPASIAASIRRKPIGTTKSSGTLPSSRVNLPKHTGQEGRINFEPVTSQSLIPATPESAKSPILRSTSTPLADNATTSRKSIWTGRKASGNNPSQSTPVSPFIPTRTMHQPLRSDINRPDDEGYPPIVKAAGDGLEGAVAQLLSSNAYIEAVQSMTNRTALLEASRKGHRVIVELLIRHGSAVDHIDANSMTALHHAVTEGHSEIAKNLLDNKATVDAKGPEEQTPLHLAATIPHPNLVVLLLQRQADVNAKDKSQRTSLHICASRGNLVMCKLLLENGAQLEIRDVNFKTALQLAIEGGHVEVVELLLTNSSLKPMDTGFREALFTAVEAGQTRLVQNFFDKGASLKGLGSDSYKAIISVAKGTSLEMLELMIQKKCKIKEKDANGWTALHFAAHHGHTHMVEKFIEKGISIKATTSKKETPLHLAVKAGHSMTTEFLLRSKGVSIGAKDVQGQEALHFAIRGGFTDIVNILLSKNANINAENAFGWRPLHIAVAYGHTALVVLLVSRGANVEEKLGTTSISKTQTHATVESGHWAEARWPYPGSRPLHLSIEYGHEGTTRFLMSKNAKVESQCSEGWRPLHQAAFNGSPVSIELLLASGAYVHALTYGRQSPLELGFRTGGTSISETDKLRVRELLQKAEATTSKQQIIDHLKNGLGFFGKSVDDRNNTLKSADLAMELTSTTKCAS